MSTSRRATLVTLLSTLAAGCGGGGDGSSATSAMRGSITTTAITSQGNGMVYPLYVYLPPDSTVDRASLPLVYLLDGESRFQTLVDIVEATASRIVIVGIGNEANRSHDYVPANSCTVNGGGQAAFFDFIRFELSPFVQAQIGGDPTRRALLGHSHGGSFVLYALFAEAAAAHHFSAYLASDASIGCMTSTVYGWESSYATSNTALPVRLHISYAANVDNEAFARQISSRNYTGLTLAAQLYPGGHIGMITAAFPDAIRFAFVVT